MLNKADGKSYFQYKKGCCQSLSALYYFVKQPQKLFFCQNKSLYINYEFLVEVFFITRVDDTSLRPEDVYSCKTGQARFPQKYVCATPN